MDITVVIKKLVALILVMSLGYISRRTNKISDTHNKGFSILLIYITLPCLIVTSMLGESVNISTKYIFQIILIGLGIYFLLICVSFFLPSLFGATDLERGVYQFLTIFNNNVFMGFPVIESVLGKDLLFYGAILNIPISLLLFTVGIYFMKKHDASHKVTFSSILTPGVVVSFLCTVLYFFHFTLPGLLYDVCSQVGNMTIPLSMIVLGIVLADMPIKRIVKDVRIYFFVLIKMLLIPLVLYGILSPVLQEKNILYVIIISLAMPGPTMSVSMATEYGSDVALASKYVFLSTILSVGTIPLIIHFLV